MVLSQKNQPRYGGDPQQVGGIGGTTATSVMKVPLVNMPVDPIYRIPDMAIDADHLVFRAMDRFRRFQTDRMNWVDRLEEFYIGFDDYLYPARKGLWDGSSNCHLPTTEIQCNNMHARFMQAFFFTYPWFFVDPQDDMDNARIDKIEKFMKYVLMRYANFNKGIYSAIDDWAWDLVTLGTGILSRGWCTKQRRAVVVEKNEEFLSIRTDLHKMLEDTDEKDFDLVAKEITKRPFIEKSIIRTVFNGPLVVAEDPLYVLFRGSVTDSTDFDQHDTVIKVCYFTADQIASFAQSQFFDEDVANSILARQPDTKGKTSSSLSNGLVETIRDLQAGVNTYNSLSPDDTYEFLMVYDNVPLKVNSKLNESIVYFVHTGSLQLARWTFLDRESSTGKIPLHMAHLYRRPRRSLGRGMVETQYALNETMDILLNQAMDSGLLANQPMFGYKGNSTFNPEEVRIEPGLGLKCDDPNTDIRFFNWNVNPNWSMGIQGMLQSFSSQLTSLGPTSSGQVGSNVGPLRSTSGVNRLAAETDVNLDVLIKRAKSCISDVYEGLYYDCMDRMPEKLNITIIGEDGDPVRSDDGTVMREKFSLDEIKGRVHFGIYANSQNMNREAQKQAIQVAAQAYIQPTNIQTGIVTPENIYNIMDDLGKSLGLPQRYKYLTQPSDAIALPFEIEIAMIIHGQKPMIVLNDPNHQKKIDRYNEIISSDQAQLEASSGIINPNAIEYSKWAIEEHMRMLEAMQFKMQNPTGEQGSPNLGQAEHGAQQQPEQQQPKPDNIPNQTINQAPQPGGPQQ